MTDRVFFYRVSSETGLGHVLISLVNAAVIARDLGRTLALDLRGFQYFAADRHRQFFQNFTLVPPPDLNVITNEADIEKLSAVTDRRYVYEQIHLRGLAAAREQVILVRGAMLSDAYPIASKTFPPTPRIALRGPLARRMAPTLAAFQRGQKVIGVYFRHGNGEFLHGRLDRVLFPEHDALYADLKLRYAERARQIAAERDLPNARFFISSDSSEFVASLKAMLPGAVSLARKLPDQNYKQHIRGNEHDPEILFEAVQDMWSLASCHALLCTSSLFSRFAALNSEILSESDVFDIEAPQFGRFLEELPPEEALPRAATAYREREAMLTAAVYGRALERAGDEARAAVLRQRARWHGQMVLDVDLRTAQVDAGEGRRKEAIALLQVFDEYSGPNPYALRLLAALYLRDGKVAAAEAALARALAADDGIGFVTAQMAQVQARKGDTAAALDYARRAVELGANDAPTLDLLRRLRPATA
jgi:tetratricopeptide (TPR) repeat protein